MSLFKEIKQGLNQAVIFEKNNSKNKKRNEKARFSITIAILIFVVLLESLLLPALLTSSFINRNSAAHMLFNMDMDMEWNSKSEYSWKPSEINQEQVNTAWSNFLGDAFVEGYTEDFYANKIVLLLEQESGVSKSDITSTMNVSKLKDYTNDFIKMQAGHLVGDNIIPSPSVELIHEYLDKVVSLVNKEQLNTWYEKNDVVLATSIADAMERSNTYLMGDAMTNRPVFKEAVLVLKVLNLLIVFYVLLSIIVILIFCLVKLCYNNRTWISLSISQFVAAIFAFATYIDMDGIYLVVMDNPYAATSVMIKDTLPIAIIGCVVFLISGGIFLILKFNEKKKLPGVISRIKK